ncbi:MAG: hypothetical protein ISS67_01690 [Desulfobacterales bacterium]|uniref:Uncharacterized protein n=1 Tax=Candidatus Desulfaltia bathyphila TaxID=2841697 RepID=A0A8J6TA36_9BACT|nr:hypothetical protein [Candidatus Desulfaltia bathyphila]MBL7195307.1 hypothetical protein [Desulfobacterales bacterium]MBL7207225.1 hypothetical protein [Desulfobacterales bacterium]
MQNYYHTFHIPVMGTGHSVDTPIRVAPFGITSVISLVDDILLEKIRKYYCDMYSMQYHRILKNAKDGRARRITAYLETVGKIVQIKMENIKEQPFFKKNDKTKYFELLPDKSRLKTEYNKLLKMKAGLKRNVLAKDLTNRMRPGSIDVNIMVKLDRIYHDNILPISDEFSDAKTALRGYADSSLESAIIFSAGINQRLFDYMTRFKEFYRNKTGKIKKKIILKVSDFRSALIQGKFLAKKGLEVYEFRIESGLNCGGHAFASNGILLPSLLKEFKEKRDGLTAKFLPLIQKYYKKMGWKYPEKALSTRPVITVQGGIGTNGEDRRLREQFGMDLTGWASPFLLVPETTCIDAPTRELLRQAGKEDLYLSDISPIEIPFNNIHKCGSEIWTKKRVAKGKPGSPCAKGFLVSNTEFTKQPICLASSQYQKMKLKEIKNMEISAKEKERLIQKVVEKTCLCDHLGNGALIALGIAGKKSSPQSICPGPNIAWYNRLYSLREMVSHIYGRGRSLVPSKRPHMFAAEIVMYVDYFEKLITHNAYTQIEIKRLREFKDNLEQGMDICLDIAKMNPYHGENLASIPPCVEEQRKRLIVIYASFKKNNIITITQKHKDNTPAMMAL